MPIVQGWVVAGKNSIQRVPLNVISNQGGATEEDGVIVPAILVVTIAVAFGQEKPAGKPDDTFEQTLIANERALEPRVEWLSLVNLNARVLRAVPGALGGNRQHLALV